jgi:CPA1 family monovalent cation:H+ antiporter
MLYFHRQRLSLSTYSIFSLLISLAAAFSYLNYRLLKLPGAIGVMLISLIASLGMVITGHYYPGITKPAVALIRSIDFSSLLMNGLLSFLLFAGSVHVSS